MEDDRTIEDIFNDINDDYIIFLNQLDKFLNEMDNKQKIG